VGNIFLVLWSNIWSHYKSNLRLTEFVLGIGRVSCAFYAEIFQEASIW